MERLLEEIFCDSSDETRYLYMKNWFDMYLQRNSDQPKPLYDIIYDMLHFLLYEKFNVAMNSVFMSVDYPTNKCTIMYQQVEIPNDRMTLRAIVERKATEYFAEVTLFPLSCHTLKTPYEPSTKTRLSLARDFLHYLKTSSLAYFAIVAMSRLCGRREGHNMFLMTFFKALTHQWVVVSQVPLHFG